MKSVTARRDGRSLDHGTLEEMRRLAVRRVLGGETQAAVARSLEMYPSNLARWMAIYREAGEEGLASRKATGRPSTLTKKQQGQLCRWIVEKNPRQFKFPFALWTLPLIGQVIEERFGVVLHKTTIARMLRRLGLTPQRPVRRAFSRDEEACRRWAEEEFPGIVRQVRRKQSTLLFQDETGVHEDGPVARTWGRRGKTPVVQVTGRRDRVNVISTISPRGRLWFRCYRGNLNAARFIGFLRDLLHDVRGEIDLVLDRHPAHVAAATRRFLHEHRARLRVHFLPAYAPELNPDEHVWGYLKNMFRREPLEPGDDLHTAVENSMETIRIDKRLVRSFFGHPEVAYVKRALKW